MMNENSLMANHDVADLTCTYPLVVARGVVLWENGEFIGRVNPSHLHSYAKLARLH